MLTGKTQRPDEIVEDLVWVLFMRRGRCYKVQSCPAISINYMLCEIFDGILDLYGLSDMSRWYRALHS